MAKVLQNGLIQMRDGRVLGAHDPINVADYVELAAILHQFNRTIAAGGFPFGGGRGGQVTQIGQGSGAPSGPAGGDLSGTYPNPNVAAIHETSGPTKLTVGAIANGEFLRRSGAGLVGDPGSGGGIVRYAASEVASDVINGGSGVPKVYLASALTVIGGNTLSFAATLNFGFPVGSPSFSGILRILVDGVAIQGDDLGGAAQSSVLFPAGIPIGPYQFSLTLDIAKTGISAGPHTFAIEFTPVNTGIPTADVGTRSLVVTESA